MSYCYQVWTFPKSVLGHGEQRNKLINPEDKWSILLKFFEESSASSGAKEMDVIIMFIYVVLPFHLKDLDGTRR